MDDIFRFPSAVRHEPAIDAWLSLHPAPLQPLAERWFVRLRECGDDVRELMHDGCAAACVMDAAFAQVCVHAKHVTIYFFRGALLHDPTGLLEGTGRLGRHVKLRPAREPDEAALEELIVASYMDMKQRLRAT